MSRYAEPIRLEASDKRVGAAERSMMRNVRGESLSRAKRNLNGLVGCNAERYIQFVTLTFRENVTDLVMARREFAAFVRRVGRCSEIKKPFRFVAVAERQKRGAVHFHVAVFVDDFDPKAWEIINGLWRKGFVWIDTRKSEGRKVAGYMGKYLEKAFADDRMGYRAFSATRGLRRPVKLNKDAAWLIVRYLATRKADFKGSFVASYVGLVEYETYSVDEIPLGLLDTKEYLECIGKKESENLRFYLTSL